jgi:hypothetical protein
MTKQQENKIVKNALKAAGFPIISVGHDTGTASNWLNIRVQLTQGQDHEWYYQQGEAMKQITRDLTGRNPEYWGGEISINWED